MTIIKRAPATKKIDMVLFCAFKEEAEVSLACANTEKKSDYAKGYAQAISDIEKLAIK